MGSTVSVHNWDASSLRHAVVPAFARTTAISSHHLLGDHHVIYVSVGGEAPAIEEGAVDHTGLLGDDEAVVQEIFRKLVGGDKFVPLMGAARQPAHDIFGADDGERKALPVAVDGRDHHHPAGLQHRRAA